MPPVINACIASVPEVAINTNQGLPDKSSVVNACTASLPEVAINTNQGLLDMPGVLHACTASLPEVAINTKEGIFDQASVLNACTAGTKAQVASVTDWTDTVPPSKATKPLEEVFPQFWELGGKELCEAIIEQTEADIEEGEIVTSEEETLCGPETRAMPVTFEDVMNARGHLGRASQVPDKRSIETCDYTKQLHKKVHVAPRGYNTHLTREGPEDKGPQTVWDKEVAELIAKHLRSKFTYHHVEGTPTVIGLLQGHQVYIHVENSNHVKHTLQLFQTQIEGSRMYTNTGVIVLPRGKRYANQLKHMRQLELELPVFMRKWNKPDGTLDRETPVRMTAWLQEVMPQGIKEALEALKARLGTPKPIEEGKEIRISKI